MVFCSVIICQTEVDPSLGTQGQIAGTRKSLNGRKIYGTKKSKERREEPLGTMSYQTSSKWSPPFWLLIGARKRVSGTNQKPERPFRLFLVPTICPLVSEDEVDLNYRAMRNTKRNLNIFASHLPLNLR